MYQNIDPWGFTILLLRLIKCTVSGVSVLPVAGDGLFSDLVFITSHYFNPLGEFHIEQSRYQLDACSRNNTKKTQWKKMRERAQNIGILVARARLLEEQVQKLKLGQWRCAMMYQKYVNLFLVLHSGLKLRELLLLNRKVNNCFAVFYLSRLSDC